MTRHLPQWVYPVLLVGVVGLLLVLPHPLGGWLLRIGLVAALGVTARYGWLRWASFTASPVGARLTPPIIGGAALLASLLLHPATGGDWWWAGWGGLTWGALLAAPGLRRSSAPPAPASPVTARMSRQHGLAVGGAGLLLAVVTLHAIPRANPTLSLVNLPAQHALFWAAVLLVGVGSSAARPAWPRIPSYGWALLALTALAFVPRLVQLEGHIHFLVDEWIFLLGVVNVQGGAQRLLEPVSYYVTAPYLFTHWQALAVAWLGPGLTATRGVSAVIGGLTVGAVGLLAYELPNRDDHRAPLALTAAGILATYPVFLHYSRLSLYNIADPLFGTLAAALVLRGLRTGSRAALAWGGVALGLTSYFYAAGKLVFPVIFGLWALGYLATGRRPWRALWVFVLAAGIVAAPAWLAGGVSRDRIAASTVVLDASNPLATAPALLAEPFTEALRMLTTTPDPPHLPYYAGAQGVVPVWLLPPFFVGLILTLSRPLARTNLLLWLWLVVPVAAMSLLDYVITARYILLMPLVAALCARGLGWFLGHIPARRHRHATLAITLAVLCAGQLYAYFAVSAPALNNRHDAILTRRDLYSVYDLMLHVRALPPNTDLHIIAGNHPDPGTARIHTLLAMMNPRIFIYVVDSDETNVAAHINALTPATQRTFMLMPDDTRTLTLIQQRFDLSAPQTSARPLAPPVKLVRYDVTTINPDR